MNQINRFAFSRGNYFLLWGIKKMQFYLFINNFNDIFRKRKAGPSLPNSSLELRLSWVNIQK